MKISIIGTGYVGLITGCCFARLGNEVTCVDVIKDKVGSINKAKPPIYEEGLEKIMREVVGKNLKATTDVLNAVRNSDITFVCVGTPDSDTGGIDLRFVESAAKNVGRALKGKKNYHVVVMKSTVVPGTTDGVLTPILEEESGKKAGEDFGVCMNPEFLREGKAIEDFMTPDRIVIGGIDEDSKAKLRELYEGFVCPKLETDLRTAEMIKYASNALLATKISFINEIANICELVGTDVEDVAKGIGLDNRISGAFLKAGAGFGGSCFPKDVKAIIELGNQRGYTPRVLESVIKTNKKQAYHMVEVLKEKLGKLEGKRIGLLGLAFKPGTDDIREAPALKMIDLLLLNKAMVVAYDPKAMQNAKGVFGDVKYVRSVEECLKGADACIIATEWDEFKKDAGFFAKNLKGKVVIDGRRVLSPEKAREAGLDYFGVGYGK